MKKVKSENGAITMIVLVSVIFIVSFLISSYVLISNKAQTQKDIIEETRKIYEPIATMEELYNSYFNNSNIVPVYTVEQLLMMGTESKNVNINGKYYNFDNDENTIYVLMNDLKFRAIDYADKLNDGYWIPIGDNTKLKAKFEGRGNTIEVIYAYYSNIYSKNNNYSNMFSYDRVEKENNYGTLTSNATYESDGYKAVIPKGFKIINGLEGEKSIAKGLVIQDAKGNEFVWIPVIQEFVNIYDYNSNYSEPKELTNEWTSSTLDPKPKYDSQEILTELYGIKEDGVTPFYSYEEDFNYSSHYEEMVASVNKYKGFYIGRYETTIDENNEIGTKANTPVLTADKSIAQTNNKQTRWYGQYYTQRNSNVVGNRDYIQTNMIWGQQWDSMIEYFDSRTIDYSAFGESTQRKVVNSAESTNSSGIKDEIYNIYDLRTNGVDWTAEAVSAFTRTSCGGCYSISNSASYRGSEVYPTSFHRFYCTRLTLYIK